MCGCGTSGWWTAAILYTLVYVLFISVMPTVANLTMKNMVTKQSIAGGDARLLTSNGSANDDGMSDR